MTKILILNYSIRFTCTRMIIALPRISSDRTCPAWAISWAQWCRMWGQWWNIPGSSDLWYSKTSTPRHCRVPARIIECYTIRCSEVMRAIWIWQCIEMWFFINDVGSGLFSIKFTQHWQANPVFTHHTLVNEKLPYTCIYVKCMSRNIFGKRTLSSLCLEMSWHLEVPSHSGTMLTAKLYIFTKKLLLVIGEPNQHFWPYNNIRFGLGNLERNLSTHHIDALMQERRNSIANALELRLSRTNPSISYWICCKVHYLTMRSYVPWYHRPWRRPVTMRRRCQRSPGWSCCSLVGWRPARGSCAGSQSWLWLWLTVPERRRRWPSLEAMDHRRQKLWIK